MSETKVIESALTQEFRALIDGEEQEERYQKFLEEHTEYLPRVFVQNHGIHLDLAIRKLSLGRDYTSDFFYLAKSSAVWHCVLIEIEKPQSRYFKTGSNDFHPDFVSALQQMNDWRAWFDVPANRISFTETTVGPLRRPLGSNPCEVKYCLVHGRRSELSSDKRRRSVFAQMRDDFKILNYDSLIEHPSARSLYMGIRKNDHFQITSDVFLSEPLFIHVEPPGLHISEKLRDDILRNKSNWHTLSTRGSGTSYWMDLALKTLVVQ